MSGKILTELWPTVVDLRDRQTVPDLEQYVREHGIDPNTYGMKAEIRDLATALAVIIVYSGMSA